MYKRQIIYIAGFLLIVTCLCGYVGSNSNTNEADVPVSEVISDELIDDNSTSEDDSDLKGEPVTTVDAIKKMRVLIVQFSPEGERNDSVLDSNGLDSDYLDSAYTINDVAMISLQPFAKAFNYRTNYDEGEDKIVISDNIQDKEIILYINSKDVFMNGERGVVPQEPIIRDEYIFVPAKYISEYFGLYVYPWRWSDLCISDTQLLIDEDTVYDDNYDVIVDEETLWPSYTLKQDGKTARGIAIGDTIEQLFFAYGLPHNIQSLDDGQVCYWYGDVGGSPGSGERMYMIFYVNGETITRVDFDGGR